MKVTIFVYASAPEYIQAMELATSVHKMYNFFEYHIYPLSYRKYWRVVRKLNKEHEWDHRGIILVIRELGFYGGPKQYIGDIDQFIEFIYEYYGVFLVSTGIKATENIGNFLEQARKEKEYFKKTEEFVKYTNVAIVGAGNIPGATRLLSFQLLQMEQLASNDGIKIKLIDLNPKRKTQLEQLCLDLNMVEEKKDPIPAVIVVDKMEEALEDCKIIILLGNFRRVYNSLYEDLKVNQYVFSIIGRCIDQVAPHNVKILLVCMKYMCFIGNVLIDNITNIDHRNIIGISAHLGEEPIPYISRASGIPAAHINGGLVWGFIGITHLIDMTSGTVNFNFFKLNDFGKKLLNKINQKFYPKKLMENQWLERDLAYLIHNLEHMWYFVGTQKEYTRSWNRHVNFVSQVKATMRMLKLWLSPPGDDAFFYNAAVPSDGTYGFPQKMFMSQPIRLNDDGFWVPYKQLKLPKDIIDLNYIIHVASEILRVTGVGESYNGSWLTQEKIVLLDVKEDYLRKERARARRKARGGKKEKKKTEKPKKGKKGKDKKKGKKKLTAAELEKLIEKEEALMKFLEKKGEILEEEINKEGEFLLYNPPSLRKKVTDDINSILDKMIEEVVFFAEEGLPYVEKQIYMDDIDFDAPTEEEIKRCLKIYKNYQIWKNEGKDTEPTELDRPIVIQEKEEPPVETPPTAAKFMNSIVQSFEKSLPSVQKLLFRPKEAVEDPYNFRKILEGWNKQEEEEIEYSEVELAASEDELGGTLSSMPSIEIPPGTIFAKPERYQPYEPEDLYTKRVMEMLKRNILDRQEKAIKDLADEVLGEEERLKLEVVVEEESRHS